MALRGLLIAFCVLVVPGGSAPKPEPLVAVIWAVEGASLRPSQASDLGSHRAGHIGQRSRIKGPPHNRRDDGENLIVRTEPLMTSMVFGEQGVKAPLDFLATGVCCQKLQHIPAAAERPQAALGVVRRPDLDEPVSATLGEIDAGHSRHRPARQSVELPLDALQVLQARRERAVAPPKPRRSVDAGAGDNVQRLKTGLSAGLLELLDAGVGTALLHHK